MLLGGCAATPPHGTALPAAAPHGPCRTASALIAFDFEGASPARCSIAGERAFTLLVTPEHAPPINPSPWYAFRYKATGDAPVTVTLRYLAARHRYAPHWRSGTAMRDLAATVSSDGTEATMVLPPGEGVVSAQELLVPGDASADLARWSAALGTAPITLGRSHDGRAVEAIRIGRADAPRLVVLLGRQHPPEVTGAIAMRAFVDTLVERAAAGGLGDLQVLAVPHLNPDGTARGHWRANLGAVDLNRDWGIFSQPETRAVKDWLDALPAGVRPVLMVDFHSTRSNLFYVQGEEASPAERRFLAAWLAGRETAVPGYAFTIEPRNANPGSGTAKNWFHARYAIPAYTYEVADDVDREAARRAARALALRLLDVLAEG